MPMTNLAPIQPDKPFLVELRRTPQHGPYFIPSAHLILTPTLRTSGLWHSLPPEEMKTLLLLLTFLSPNGECCPTLLELADAMQTSQAKAQARLQRLCRMEWQGQPLVQELPRENGLDAFVPAPTLLATVEAPILDTTRPEPPLPGVGLAAVIGYSRARYNRPRAEVEQEIARLNGWSSNEEQHAQQEAQEAHLSPEQKELLVQLTQQGIERAQAIDLLAQYEPECIARQLAWLPFRHANSPARFLLAAVVGDYEEPAALRLRSPRPQTAQLIPEQATALQPLLEPEEPEEGPMQEVLPPVPLPHDLPLPPWETPKEESAAKDSGEQGALPSTLP